MPTIKKLPPKKREQERNWNTETRLLRRQAYNNTAWRKLRNSYLKLHPLCENCLKEGKVVPAEDVHHKRSPFQKGEINWTLLMEVENLQSLCKECHGKEHAKEQGHVSPEDVIAGLEALLKDDD